MINCFLAQIAMENLSSNKKREALSRLSVKKNKMFKKLFLAFLG